MADGPGFRVIIVGGVLKGLSLPAQAQLGPIHLAPISRIDPAHFDVLSWQHTIEPWLKSALDDGFGANYRELLTSAGIRVDPGQLPTRLGDLNRHVARVQFENAGRRSPRAPGFDVLAVPGQQLGDRPWSNPLLNSLREKVAIDVRPTGEMIPLFDYFMRVSQLGYGPLTPFQAQTIRKLSPRIVDAGTGAGFNTAMLKAVSTDGSVVSFDSGEYHEPKYVRQFTGLGERMGGPAAADDLEALSKWVYSDPSRFIGQWLRTDKASNVSAFRSMLCALTPKYGERPRQGGPEMLRERELAGHDLFIAFPPSTGNFQEGLVARCLDNLSPEARWVHVMPGNFEPWETHPLALLKLMGLRGWVPKTVIPSSLTNAVGINDVVVFERMNSFESRRAADRGEF